MATKENFLPIFYYEFFAVRALGSPGDRPVRKGQEFEKCYNFTTVLQSEEGGREAADLAIIMTHILERKGDIIKRTLLTLQTQ